VPTLVARSQSATLHSTGNISAEDSVHKYKVGHNSTRGTESSLLFTEFTAAQSLHFQHHMWTEVVQDAYSKKKPFVSNVHFNILMNISLQEQFRGYPSVL
jgi:hypothetical protein